MPAIFRFILTIPYVICLYLLKFSSKVFLNIDVWPRHSYVNGTFVPVKSDLDISIFIRNAEQGEKFNRLYVSFKFVFPFLGEVNAYTPEIFEFLKKYPLNIYELQRDPILIKKLNLFNHPEEHVNEKVLVYLHRVFMSDYEHLRSKKSRAGKWAYHFATVNSHLKSISEASPYLVFFETEILRSVSTGIINLTFFNNKEEAELERSKFLMLTEFISHKKDFVWTPLLPQEFKMTTVYFPEYVSYFDFELPKINSRHLPILVAEIEWFILINLRKCYRSDFREHALKELELFFKLLTKISEQHKDSGLEATQLKLTSCKNILLALS